MPPFPSGRQSPARRRRDRRGRGPVRSSPEAAAVSRRSSRPTRGRPGSRTVRAWDARAGTPRSPSRDDPRLLRRQPYPATGPASAGAPRRGRRSSPACDKEPLPTKVVPRRRPCVGAKRICRPPGIAAANRSGETWMGEALEGRAEGISTGDYTKQSPCPSFRTLKSTKAPSRRLRVDRGNAARARRAP